MRTRLYAASAAIALLLAGTAGAATTQTEKGELQRARNEVAVQASTTKGAAQQHFDLERRRLDGLIDDLQSGRRVSPEEVERAIDQTRTIP